MNLDHIEEIIILNWNRICRVCLSDECALFPLVYSHGLHELSFVNMINNIAGLEVSPDDHLPQLLCSKCINLLCNAIDFQLKCRASENRLIKLYTKKIYIDSKKDVKFEEVKLEIISHRSEDQVECDKMQTGKLGECYEVLADQSSFINMNNVYPDRNIAIKTKKHIKESTSIVHKDQTRNIQSNNHKRSKECSILDETNICPICNIVYDNNIKLQKHKSTHSNTCWKCNTVLNNRKEYEKHLMNHKKLVCTECGKLYKIKSEQCTEHLAWYTEEKTHLCTICGKNYASLSALLVHNRNHTGEKRYACEYCDRKFMHWSARRHHTRSHHTKEKPYECQICNKRFLESKTLKLHIRDHTGERPFSCTECDKKFKEKKRLRMHMYRHTGERKVFCKICNKGFIQNYSLKLHMATHTGIRNFVCLVCDKSFTQAHVLRNHMKTHPESLDFC